MELSYDDLPEWEIEARLSHEADPVLELALQSIDELTFEQQLALLDKLGIDYSHCQVQPVVEPEPEVIEFSDLF